MRNLCYVEVAFRIQSDPVDVVKLPGVAALVTNSCYFGAVLPVEDMNDAVLAISHIKIFLRCVLREGCRPHVAESQRLGPDKKFLNEFTVLRKDLDSVAFPIPDINETIVRYF